MAMTIELTEAVAGPATTNLASTALAMAMVAPTERSMPPVPMTRAMPERHDDDRRQLGEQQLDGGHGEKVRGGDGVVEDQQQRAVDAT